MEKSKINKILKTIPRAPGVYKMKNSAGKIIYIGKAKDLKSRVSHYFQTPLEIDPRMQKMISEIENIDYTETPSELEAIFLETNLIKELKPKYNIKMRDDKNFVYIRIDVNEDYPKISLVRKPLNDKALYFGPKTASHKVKKTLSTLRKILPFRHCNLNIEFLGKKNNENEVKITNKTIRYPCLDYHIHKCVGPCVGKCAPEEYKSIIDKVIKFFKGNTDELIADLKKEMAGAVSLQKFEKASGIRDKIKNIEEITMKQYVSNLAFENADIMNYVIDSGKIYTNLFQVRDYRIIGQENFIFDADAMKKADYILPSEITEAFIKFYYEQAVSIPNTILVPYDPEDAEILEKWLNKLSGVKAKITVPQRGESNKLLELALLGARSFANQSRARWMHEQGIEEGLESLEEILRLEKIPKRIECFDVSHLSGKETVGSMIVFINGVPFPAHYRKFKLSQTSPDDYASMKELLERRLQKLVKNKLPKGFILKKALKKYAEQMRKTIKREKLAIEKFNYKDFFIILKGVASRQLISSACAPAMAGRREGKILAGMIGVLKRGETYRTSGLFVDPKFRGQKLSYYLLSKAVSSAPAQRIYLICKKSLREHYEAFGFEEIHHLPDDLKNIENCTTSCPIEGMLAFVYDKKRHVEDKSFFSKPDLILLDGGQGQLTAGIKTLEEFTLKIPIASLTKQQEEIFVPWQSKSIKLGADSPALQIFQRARDEAHRFAISYMKSRHGKEMIESEITSIPGIGEKTMQKLFRAFGSMENIKNTPMDKIADIVGKSAAIKIKQYLQEKQ